jgi:methylated-DNA-[protein]-cysteine S-methyltransferase
VKLLLNHIASPLGEILLVTDEQQRLRALDFADHRTHLHRVLKEHCGEYELVDAASAGAIETHLDRFFAGELNALDDVQPSTNGNELQQQVWAALRTIPAGQVVTYGELARKLGYTDPRMAKDIGAAVGANPIAIVVPCHRVIGADGELKGYAWGLHRKRWLLEHEGAAIGTHAAQAQLDV